MTHEFTSAATAARAGLASRGLLLLLATLSLACAETSGSGAIDVSWSIGGSTCNQSGVSRMVVRLYHSGEQVLDQEGVCTEGGLRVEGVPQGTFVVEVTAYRDGSADPAYVGHVSGVTVPKGGAVTAPEVALEEAPGALDVSWRFADGRLCRFAGVSRVQVGIFDLAGRRASERSLACDPAPEPVSSAAPGASYIEDAKGIVFDRLLPGTYTLNLFAYGASSDTPVFYGTSEAVVNVYELTPVDVVLAACPEGANSPCL